MKIEDLTKHYPRLYHVAETGMWKSIRRHGLLSTKALLDLFEIAGVEGRKIEEERRAEYFVFTSNVDGHFQKAGFSPERIVECHGSIHHSQCSVSCTDEIWDADGDAVSVDAEKFRAQEPLPKCRNCAALARPNILMFGDWSWLGHRTEAQEERFAGWLNGVAKPSARLAVIELGAGSAIPTVRSAAERVLESTGGTLIRINPGEDDVPSGQIGLPLGAAEGIRRICERMENLDGDAKLRD